MRTPFYLDDWLVEPELDRITRNGVKTSLRPQVMDLLVFLASRPKGIIASDDILAEVWCGKVATHASVYNCLKELRHALEDDPHRPSYIETIPKRGYRLLAKVRTPKPTGRSGLQETPAAYRFTPSQLAITFIAIALAVMLIVDRSVNQQAPEFLPSPAVPEKSIAVLPFEDMSLAGDQEYFADGITEEILDGLGNLPELRVTARSSSFAFRGKQEDIKTIGDKLGVAYVLEGSVKTDAGQVQVTAQLTDTRSGLQVWSGEYSHDPGDIYSIQDVIGAEVASALQVRMPNNTLPGEIYPDWKELDVHVYDQYLQARSLINQHRKESLQEAIELLQGVLEADPNFVRARLLLADSLLELSWEYQVNYGFESLDLSHGFKLLKSQLLDSTREIINAKPDLADAHLVWGKLMRNDWKVEEAETALLRALEINPSLADAHRNLGWNYLARSASLNKAIASFRRAVELDPLSLASRLSLARTLSGIPGAREESWSVFRAAKAGFPWTPSLGTSEADLLVSEGRYAEAIFVLEDTISREDHPLARYQLANGWYQLGEAGRARELKPGFELWRDEPNNSELPDYDRCPGNPDDDNRDLTLWRSYVCMSQRQWENVITNLARIASHQDELVSTYSALIGRTNSPAFSLALAYKMTGNQVLSDIYTRIEQDSLDGRTEHGKIRGWFHAQFNARLLAINGQNDKAMDELEAMLKFRHLDPRVFRNPVYDPIRNTLRFRSLENQRIRLVNQQRVLLGLAPLELLEATFV